MGCVWTRIIGLELFFDGDFDVCFLLTADLLGRVVPNPVENTTDFRDFARRIKLRYMLGWWLAWSDGTHHGCVTDQCRKTPDRPRSIMSVTTTWPSLNRTPAMAGRRAKARDREANDEVSGMGVSWPARALGLSRLRASSRL